MAEPMQVETDVLVIGSGAAGMYAAIEAARAGCRVFLIDRSLIGRGGATVMAQMTVAVALGAEAPDHWSHHYQDTLTAGRGLCNEPLSRLLCEEGPACIQEMDAWGVGWARKNGKITAAFAPGHDRPRCVYVDFLNTGPAVSKTLRTVVHKTPGITRTGDLCVVDLLKVDGESRRRGRLACRHRRAGRDLRQGDHRRHRRADAALPPQQRLHQHGRRRLRAVSPRRRAADRHGVRAVLPDRASGAAADRHGPDHVGPVPLQARRPAAQQGHAGVHRPLRRAGGRQIRHHPRCRHLRHHQGGRGRPRLAARRRLSELPARAGGKAARGVRPGDRPARGQRHRSHQDAGRGGADRALPHGRRRRRRERCRPRCRASWSPAKRSAAPTARTGFRATPSPRRSCSAARPGAPPPRGRRR